MGKTVSKEQREEVIIAQTGLNNNANASQDIAGDGKSYLTIATGIMIVIIFCYLLWKRIHKCLTKKIERQAAAAVMRRRASV